MDIVLGGGISGLIWAHYNSDCFILTDQIGGQMLNYFDLGPRYLHYKQQIIDSFLRDLNVPLKLSTIRIGYIDDSGYIQNPGEEFRKKYFMKSRGQNTLQGFDPTVLNSNIKEFQVCNIDFKDLIDKLYDKLEKRIYMGKVTHINLNNSIITTDNNLILKYKNLISTIPLNVFAKVANLDIKLQAFDMAYCLLSNNFFDLKKFDYVYDVRSSTVFHRMTKCRHGIVCDVLGTKIEDFKNQVLPKYFTSSNEQAIVYLKNSQIISLEKDFELQNYPVKFVGRYSAWNRRWKTETVIEEAIKHKG